MRCIFAVPRRSPKGEDWSRVLTASSSISLCNQPVILPQASFPQPITDQQWLLFWLALPTTPIWTGPTRSFAPAPMPNGCPEHITCVMHAIRKLTRGGTARAQGRERNANELAGQDATSPFAYPTPRYPFRSFLISILSSRHARQRCKSRWWQCNTPEQPH